MASLITSYLWLDLAVTALVIFLCYFFKDINYWKKRNVPYISPFSFFGNILPIVFLKRSVGQYMEELHKESIKRKTPVLGFWIAEKPCLFVSDPELTKKMLVRDFAYFNDRLVGNHAKFDPIGTQTVFTMKQPHWKNMRTRLSQLFTSSKMKQFSHTVIRNADNLVNFITEHNKFTGNQPLASKNICGRYTADNIVSVFLGLEGQCLMDTPGKVKEKEDPNKGEIPQYNKVGDAIMGITPYRALELSCSFLAPEINHLFGFRFFSSDANAFFNNIFWGAAKLRKEADKNVTTKQTDGSLLSLLLQFKDEKIELDGLKYEGDVLVAQFGVFFSAGFETSSSSMSLLLSILTKHPEVQDRIRNEIKEVITKHKEFNYDSLADMTYLDMAYKEILRFYPTLPFLDRLCTKDYKIEGTNIVIEKGTKIFMSLTGLHCDPRYWKNPEVYDPERFSKENKHNIVPFSYIPFGEGPKICLGERFGVLQSKLGLAKILSMYRVRASDNISNDGSGDRIPIAPRGVVVTPEHPLMMYFDYDPICAV